MLPNGMEETFGIRIVNIEGGKKNYQQVTFDGVLGRNESVFGLLIGSTDRMIMVQ